MQSRREFIKHAALVSGAVGLWGALGDSVRRATAIEPHPGTSYLDAEHVVILMQENRSFDHCFGSLQGVRGFNDPRAIRLPSGNPVWVQTDAAGQSFVPFRLNIKDTRATWMGCLPHSWETQVDARNCGLHDRWLEAKRSAAKEYASMPLTLGYYTRDDIPFYYELADAFTVCDQHFCSSLTGTTPNRLHLWTGTLRAAPSAGAQANVANEDADYGQWVRWTTFPERLEDHGVSWKIYQNELGIPSGLAGDEEAWLANFGDNPIEYFSQFNVRLAKARRAHVERQVASLPADIAKLRGQLDDRQLSTKGRATLRKQIEELEHALSDAIEERRTCTAERYESLSPRDRSLHQKAFCINDGDPDHRRLAPLTYTDGNAQRQLQVPKGDVFHQFRSDVRSGKLPAVSWIVAPERFSDHPSSAWYGAWYISEAMNILTQDPEVWRKTIFILTYDENDGYFDHVPPFVAPHPRRPETGRVSDGIDPAVEYVELEQDLQRVPHGHARESPVGLGYRVPMVIASPWSRGGCVCSQVFDHTSVLQLLENVASHKTGRPLVETNISAWRRTVCGDLGSAFRPAQRLDAPLRFPPRDEVVKAIHTAKFKPLPAGYQPLDDRQIEQLRQGDRARTPMPRQEPGVRPAAPLPYELYADAALRPDTGRLVLTLTAANTAFGDRSAGCPFTAYGFVANGGVRVRNYAVSAGGSLEDEWDLADFDGGPYRLSLHGPNGFYRQWTGTRASGHAITRLRYARDAAGGLSGNVDISVTNRGAASPLRVEVADRSYHGPAVTFEVRPGGTATRTIDLAQSFGWHDVSVTSPDLAGFEHRFAGHVEDGKWSFTDPAMGEA